MGKQATYAIHCRDKDEKEEIQNLVWNLKSKMDKFGAEVILEALYDLKIKINKD